MKPSEVVFNDEISNRDKFGFYVNARRKELGIKVRELAENLGISGPYLSDIEKGNRMAPLDFLEQMAALLEIEESELEFFVDLAGCSHSNWPEINEYLAKNRNARYAIRLARDYGLSDEEFLAIVAQYADEKLKQPAEAEKQVEKSI